MEFLFGVPYLQAKGYQVDILELSDLSPDPRSPEYRAIAGRDRAIQQATGFTSAAHPFVGALEILNGYDAIVAAGDSIALGLSHFVRQGTLKVPMFAICMLMLQKYPARAVDAVQAPGSRHPLKELYDRVVRGRYRQRARWYRQLLESCRGALYFTRAEYEMVGRTFPDVASRARLSPQCVDTDFWRPAAPAGGDHILIMGNDRGRDFDLARAVAARLPGRRFTFVTRRLRQEEVPANVTVMQGDWKTSPLTDGEVRAIVRDSAIVMMPFRTESLDTLTSVALQGMACEKPVVVSKTAAAWEPEFVDGQHFCLVPSSDPGEWCGAIEALINDPARRARIGANARSLVERRHNMTVLGAEVEQLIACA